MTMITMMMISKKHRLKASTGEGVKIFAQRFRRTIRTLEDALTQAKYFFAKIQFRIIQFGNWGLTNSLENTFIGKIQFGKIQFLEK